jgi:Mlc titration factor MtfA (ptsG expression regulator)
MSNPSSSTPLPLFHLNANQDFLENSIAPAELQQPILGQAFRQGPVIIVWDAVLRGGHHPELGYNVVYHDFAHKLDMLDGTADGTPPLRDRAE